MRWILLVFLLISCNDNTEDEMKLFISSLSTDSGETPPWVLPPNSIRITGLTGQSNAGGNGFNSQALPSEIDLTSSVYIKSKVNTTINQLDISSGNNIPNISNAHGIELGLSLGYENDFTYPLYLSKRAVGGSTLEDNLPGGPVYDEFWPDFMKYMINFYLGEGKRVFVDLIFIQGEAEANATDIASHAGLFDQWVSQWQTNLGNELPLSVVQIYQSNTYTAQVNQNFANKAATEPYLNVIQASELTTNDGLHYDYASFKIIAERYFTRMEGVTPMEITSIIP